MPEKKKHEDATSDLAAVVKHEYDLPDDMDDDDVLRYMTKKIANAHGLDPRDHKSLPQLVAAVNEVPSEPTPSNIRRKINERLRVNYSKIIPIASKKAFKYVCEFLKNEKINFQFKGNKKGTEFKIFVNFNDINSSIEKIIRHLILSGLDDKPEVIEKVRLESGLTLH